MKVVVDTNVIISGIFFSGPPYEILNAWRDKRLQIVFSPAIVDEYQRVEKELGKQFSEIDIEPFMELLMIEGHLINAPLLLNLVCKDPDDEKFIACAIASQTKIIISGDKHLLNVSGHKGIEIIRPRLFIEKYLKNE
ncbi:MAG: putative toxin-antitoxin system toxin component, PIN family [Deltaproteobacteria bacterium]|nr:putative toxin-antitoxin system toxin component, PIN family [Deltaproteobacteria bacterium]